MTSKSEIHEEPDAETLPRYTGEEKTIGSVADMLENHGQTES